MDLKRLEILLASERWERALEELGELLQYAPDDPLLLYHRSRCLLELERFEEAEESARDAIAHGPLHAFSHYILGLVLHRRNRPEEALRAFSAALELDPAEPLYYGQLALVHIELKSWSEALKLADGGLELDAASPLCLNARARALAGLGNVAEAQVDLYSHLAEAPDDPLTHANLGWLALEKGDPKGALEHFEAALAAEPEMEWARQGLLEALRSRYPLYRWLLGYFLWLGRLPPRTQWAIVLGGYFVYRGGLQLSRSHPQLAPFLLPFFVLYVLFVYLTWTGTTATNLLLRFNRYGRRLLNAEEVRETNWVAAAWLGAAAAFLAVPFTELSTGILGGILLVQAVLICNIYRSPAGWPRATMIGINLVMALLGLGGYAGYFLLRVEESAALLTIYFPAILFTLIGSNYLGGVRVKR